MYQGANDVENWLHCTHAINFSATRAFHPLLPDEAEAAGQHSAQQMQHYPTNLIRLVYTAL
jgi:hypothetical protein